MRVNPAASEGAEHGPGVGDRLPPLATPSVDEGHRIAWRAPGRGAPVVVFLSARDEGSAYVQDLAEAESEVEVWDGRIIIVLPGRTGPVPEMAAAAAPSLTLVSDADGEAHRRCGVRPGTSALFIADRWGQIYFARRTRSERELPGSEEIVEWLRYLATQCPECGVPDEPGRGEWTV